MNLLPRLPDKWRQKAPVAPIGTSPAEAAAFSGPYVGTWGPLGGLPALSHGYVHEPFPGGWQRNVDNACHPSIIAFSAVYACVYIISSDIAKLPICVKNLNPDGSSEDAVNNPYHRLMWKPNAFQTRMDFIQYFLVSALLTGNAYAWKERDAKNQTSALYPLNPNNVQVLVADSGDIFYKVKRDKLSGVTRQPNGKLIGEDFVILPASEIIHHRLMCLEHPLIGSSPLYAAATSASVGASIIMQSGTFFRNQSRPSGMLVAPGRITKESALQMKQAWEENYSGGQMGRTAVLGNGLTWQPITITAGDAQLIEQLKWSKEDVATVFRVPLFLLAGGQNVTYNNSEQLMRGYYSGCLQYHIEALEMRFDDAFGLPNNQEIEFDLMPLLRTEMNTRFESYSKAVSSGFKTLNEVRKLEGDKPIKGGDEPLVQKQYVPLSMLGQVNSAKPARPAKPATPPTAPEGGDSTEPSEPAANEEKFDVPKLAALFDDQIARTHIGTAA